MYNSLNQLTSSQQQEESEDGLATIADKTYTYDKNGNQITETDSITGQQNMMSYDADNRLTKYLSKQDGATILTQENAYNEDGQRIRKTEIKDGDTQQNNYFYQGSMVLYTTDGSSALTSLNLMGLEDNVISTMRGTGGQEKPYLYTKDTRGSMTNLLDDQGNAVVSYGYDEFGETTVKGDEGFYNEIGYTGQIRDANTGLYYYNARYYDPEVGRFITQDTYRGEKDDVSALHLYTYCANNPINYTDPTGHWKIGKKSPTHQSMTQRVWSWSSTNKRNLKPYNLKMGSTAPDRLRGKLAYFYMKAEMYHGKEPNLYIIKKNLINKAAKAYRKKTKKGYEDASWYLGVTMHVVQDYWAHNIKYKGKWTWHATYRKKTGDKRHGDTFDNINKYYSSGKWVTKNFLSNSRIYNAWNSTSRVFRDFRKKV